MPGETCGTCRWYRAAKPDVGTCHGGPPTVMLVGMAPHPVTQQPVPVTNSFWPQVRAAEEGCSMHRVDVRSIDVGQLEGVGND